MGRPAVQGDEHTLELELALEIGVVESLHWNLVSDTPIQPPELLILDSDVTFQASTGQDTLLVDPRSDPAHDPPIADRYGYTKEGDEEEVPCPRV